VNSTGELDRTLAEADPEAVVPVRPWRTPANGELPTSASVPAATIELPLVAQLGSRLRIQASSWEMRETQSV
jgi:hypothetical protein